MFNHQGEIIMTSNIVLSATNEAMSDRICVIPVSPWSVESQNSTRFVERRAKYDDLMQTNIRPTQYAIGEMGKFFRLGETYILSSPKRDSTGGGGCPPLKIFSSPSSFLVVFVKNDMMRHLTSI